MQDTNGFISSLIRQMSAQAPAQTTQQISRLTAPQPAPTLDPGDPVAQTLAAMHSEGSLPASAPAHAAMPAESQVHGLMQNLMHNSAAAGDSGVGMRTLAMIGDLLDAPRHAVQSLVGTDQNQMDEAYKRLAEMTPAPSSTQMLQMAMAGMGGGPGVAKFLEQVSSGQDTERRWSPTTVKIAGDTLTDPTSYIGVGIGKGLLKAGVKAGVPLAVEKGLKLAAEGDEAAAAALGAIGDMVVKGVQMGLFKAPNFALAQKFPELPMWTEYAHNTTAMGDALQWLENKGLDLNVLQSGLQQGTLKLQDVVDQLPTQLAAEIDPKQLRQAITGTQTIDREVAYQGYKKWLMKDMGLDNPNKARNFYTQFTDWWKQQALASLSYIYSNSKSGILGSLLENGPGGAARTAADLVDNAGHILAGRPFNTDRAMELASATGAPIPKSLHEMADNALNATSGPANARTLLGSKTRDALLGAGVGALGAYADDQNPIVGALAGAGAMAALPKVASRIRKSSQGVETVLRESGWVEGMSKDLARNILDMNAEIASILTKPGARASGTAVSQNFLDQIAQHISDQGGQVSSDALRAHLLNNVRVTPQRVEEATRALDDALYAASQNGVKTSNAFNFDYQDLSNVERVITQVAPFSTWYLKAIPFYTKQGFQHPVLANLVTSKAETSAQMQSDRNLPSRFAGTLPNQAQGGLMSAIVGRPLEAFSDPLAALLPFGGAARDIQNMQFEDRPDADPIKIILGYLGAAGLGLNPAISTGLQVAGIGSDMSDPSNSSLLRWGGPLGGATALAGRAVGAATGETPDWYINPSRGVQKIIDTVRQTGDAATHGGQGRQVLDGTELAIERRVDELALKQTGKPIGSDDPAIAPYMRAKVNKSGPIWQQASTEVHQERGTQSLLGFVSPDLRPDAVLTPEEAKIRLAKGEALIDPAVAHDLTQAASTRPNDMADPKIVAQVQAANDVVTSITGKPTPQVISDRLANPTNANVAWVSGQIYGWSADQQPLMQGYGSGGSPEARRISNELGMMSHAGEDIAGPDQAALVQANQAGAVNKIGSAPLGSSPSLRGTGPLAAAGKIPQEDQTQIKANDPLLAEYFAWKAINPAKNLEEFLKQKFGK